MTNFIEFYALTKKQIANSLNYYQDVLYTYNLIYKNRNLSWKYNHHIKEMELHPP